MSLSSIINLSFNGILKFKMRSFLMMLGIIIGIATLTAIVSIGKGSQKKVTDMINRFGPNGIMIFAGGGKKSGPFGEVINSLKLEDAEAISKTINGIKYIAPVVANMEQNITYEENSISTPVFGVTPEWEDAYQIYVENGIFFTDEDNLLMSRTCLVGQTIVTKLFDNQDPIGESIRINSSKFKIIGVLPKQGTGPHGRDRDLVVLIPLKTAMRRLYNINYLKMIRLYVDTPDIVNKVTKQVSQLLRQRHSIIPPKEDDFNITNATYIAKMSEKVTGTLTTFLLILAIISLVVGSIVISNIMFISVNERKGEIGIRRAFGARKIDIIEQILGEVLIISIIGGIVGSITGFIVSHILSVVKEIPAVITWEPFLIAVGVSIIVGIISGLQPARRAASMEIVNAIRGS